MPYMKIDKIDDFFEPTHVTTSDFVFLQLGNFEFSASWRQILSTTVGLPRWVASGIEHWAGLPEVLVLQSVAGRRVAAAKLDSLAGLAGARASGLGKVAFGGYLYVLTWVLMRKHRQQFRLMNRVVRQNPQSTFICLTPFPCVAGPHNWLRRLGGLILRHRFDAHPNLRWVDSHRVLQLRSSLFEDGVHLNEKGHQLLAAHLQALCQTGE